MESTSNDTISYGKRVRIARVTAGYTVKQLADELGVVYDTVYNYEHDISFPNDETRLKIDVLLCNGRPLYEDDKKWRDMILQIKERYKSMNSYMRDDKMSILDIFMGCKT